MFSFFQAISIGMGIFRAYFLRAHTANRFSFIFPIKLGKNSEIGVLKGANMILGKHVSINNNAHIASTKNAHIEIGSFTGIGNNCVIVAREKISIGNNVMIGPNVCIYDHDHIFKEDGIMRELGYETAPVTIEDNVWLAAGVIVLKGVTIGEGSVIAAGTLVNKDIPRNSVVYNRRELVIKERIEGI